MALIGEFIELQKERNQVHGPVQCGWTVFELNGARYLQLDTYGSERRQVPGKTSQSIQLDAAAAAELKSLIGSVFPET